MNFDFYKYEVCGNDFILISKLQKTKSNFDNSTIIKRLCDRNFGIGADGLIFLEKKSKYDFDMIYYNSNGIESSLCGNGARACVHLYNIIKNKKEVTFQSKTGIHKGKIDKKGKVHVELKHILFNSITRIDDDYLIDTGSPHYVKFINDFKKIDFIISARNIRNNKQFHEKGVNVNFTQKIIKQDFNKTTPLRGFYSRTYERGVENETLSCGTGAAAIAICLSESGIILKNKYRILFKGGEIGVTFNKNLKKLIYENIFLSSSVNLVFKGIFEN